MATSSLLKLANCLLVVYLVMASPKAVTAITCGQVASKLGPCLPYVKGTGASIVPPPCCSGIKFLLQAAKTTLDRQTICKCLKSFAGSVPGVNYSLVAGLPSKCGVSIPYKISPSTDCNRLQVRANNRLDLNSGPMEATKLTGPSRPKFPYLHALRALPVSPRTLPVTHRLAICTRIYALSSNDIKVGTNIEVDGAPWRVLEFLHVKPGKGAAFVRTKLRNYVTGNTVEKTFRAGSSIEEADVFKETRQFTYKDGSQFVFMDLTTFEEIRLNEADVGNKTKWLKEGMDCNLIFWNEKVIDFELPITVQLTVVDAPPGVRGDTVQGGGGSKLATLETGATVNVPLFVNVGDDILVDTRTGQYMSRA
ncbi:hypothetical protein SAY86_020824 [Trapa natans]|uniref:Non-specific lipid-transfer protein n=1 Tax=Trapa natans TaxID=22666 RepID=A0AAN7M8S4_TRANT|nr:hypothetical protein SAY86_020824 [Trapa natans]